MKKLLQLFGFGQVTNQKPNDNAAYKIFSSDFDRIVEFSDIDTAIGVLQKDQLSEHRNQLEEFDRLLINWPNLLKLRFSEAVQRISGSKTYQGLNETVVGFLIDQSGSMRGSKMTHVAAAVALMVQWLNGIGCKTEVLGFTTRHWIGGRSRKVWKLEGKPRNPGRLNDLLHIVYHSADSETQSIEDAAVSAMLRPDLLKENLDGEALEWAVGRLNSKPEFRQILIVISDGAPVDDSTLTENPSDYLYKHVRSVISQIEARSSIELWGMGIQYSVEGFYQNCESSSEIADIPIQLIKLVERALTTPRP